MSRQDPHLAVPSAVTRLGVHLRWQSGSEDLRCSGYLFDEAVSLVARVSADPHSQAHPLVVFSREGAGQKAVVEFGKADEVVALLVEVVEKEIYNDNDWLVVSLRDASDYAPPGVLLEFRRRMQNEFKRLAVLALYLHREVSVADSEEHELAPRTLSWVALGLRHPVLGYAVYDTPAIYGALMVSQVPLFSKFKRKQLNDIAEVCTALTTRNLLFFKDHFNDSAGGLAIDAFTELLFVALSTTYPRILDRDERAFAVALLNELFYQIGTVHPLSSGTPVTDVFQISTEMVSSAGRSSATSASASPTCPAKAPLRWAGRASSTKSSSSTRRTRSREILSWPRDSSR